MSAAVPHSASDVSHSHRLPCHITWQKSCPMTQPIQATYRIREHPKLEETHKDHESNSWRSVGTNRSVIRVPGCYSRCQDSSLDFSKAFETQKSPLGIQSSRCHWLTSSHCNGIKNSSSTLRGSVWLQQILHSNVFIQLHSLTIHLLGTLLKLASLCTANYHHKLA